MKAKHMLKIAAFTACVLLMIGTMSQLLRDKSTTLHSYYSLPRNAAECIFVGSSRVTSSVIPAELYQQYGIAACNTFSWMQPMWISYYYIREALRFSTPKVVVLDMDGVMYGDGVDEANYANSFSIDPTFNYYRMLGTVGECGFDKRDPVDFLNIIRYHSRWQYLTAEDAYYNPHNDFDYMLGYGLSFTVNASASTLADTSDAVPVEPYDKVSKYLDKIRKLCTAKGIALVLMMTPYDMPAEHAGYIAWAEQYAKAHDLPMLNFFGELGRECGIDLSRDLLDGGHLNYYGAQKVTAVLGEYLSSHYAFTPKDKQKHKKVFDTAVEGYNRILAIDAKEKVKSAAWLQEQLSDDKQAVYLLCPQQAALNEPMSGILRHNNISLPKAPFAMQLSGGEQGAACLSAEAVELSFPFKSRSRKMRAALEQGSVQINNGKATFFTAQQPVFLIYDTILHRPLSIVTQSHSDGADIVYKEITTADIIKPT